MIGHVACGTSHCSRKWLRSHAVPCTAEGSCADGAPGWGLACTAAQRRCQSRTEHPEVQSGAGREAGAAGSAPGEPHPHVTACATLFCQIYGAPLHAAGVLVWTAGSLDVLDSRIFLKAACIQVLHAMPSHMQG